MKNFWLLSLVLIAACGKVDMPSDAQLEPIKNASRLVTGNELGDFTEICDALNTKKNYLASLKNSTYVFAGSSKACTDTAFAQLADANIMLIEQYGDLKFNEGNVAAYFSEVEEIDKGNFADICSNLSNLVSPMSKDGINYVHFTTDASPSDCPVVAEQQCVKFEKGVKKTVEGVEMTDVHTREWIRVKLNSPTQTLIGFWSYKKRLSEAGCVDGYNFARTATLK